jgi:hypothetical protein
VLPGRNDPRVEKEEMVVRRQCAKKIYQCAKKIDND